MVTAALVVVGAGALAAAALDGPAAWPIVAGATAGLVLGLAAGRRSARCAAGSTATRWVRPIELSMVIGLAATAVVAR